MGREAGGRKGAANLNKCQRRISKPKELRRLGPRAELIAANQAQVLGVRFPTVSEDPFPTFPAVDLVTRREGEEEGRKPSTLRIAEELGATAAQMSTRWSSTFLGLHGLAGSQGALEAAAV